MEVFQGWDENGKKATVIRVSRHEANHWRAWDSSMANPATLFDAERAFCSMLTTARKVVQGFETGTPLEADCVTAPIRNLYAWHLTCKRFVESRLVALLIARSKIPSSSDYQGTQTRSFCEQSVKAVERLIHPLWHFVESPNQDHAEQVQAASSRGEKLNLNPIHADDLLTYVASELQLLKWTVSRWTMKNLAARIGMDDGTLSKFIPGEKAKGRRSKLTDEIVITVCQRIIKDSPTASHCDGAKALLAELMTK